MTARTLLAILAAVWFVSLAALWVWSHCAVDDEWGEPTAPVNLDEHRVTVDPVYYVAGAAYFAGDTLVTVRAHQVAWEAQAETQPRTPNE